MSPPCPAHALMIQGLTPGPLLFQEHGATVNGIFASPNFYSVSIAVVVRASPLRILGKRSSSCLPRSSCPSCSRCAAAVCANKQLHIRHRRNGRLRAAWRYLMLKAGFPAARHASPLGPLASNFRRALSSPR